MHSQDPFHVDAPDLSATSPVASQSLPRRLAANWWRILLVWIGLSAPLMVLLHHWIEPTYRAVSAILVESTQPELFGPSIWRQEAATGQAPPYLHTEIEIIKSNRTLDAALAGRLGGTNTLSLLRDAEDPVMELRKKLEVSIIPNTHFIEVALEARNPEEAAKIVNAIVGTYTEYSRAAGAQSIKQLFYDLENYKQKLMVEIQKIMQEIREIADKADKATELKSEKNLSHKATVETNFLNYELAKLRDRHDQVERKIEQLRFVQEKGNVTVEDTYEAVIPRTPTDRYHWEYMGLMSLSVLGAVFGLFFIKEWRRLPQ